MSLSERADHLEEQMMHELETVITKSVFCHLTDGKVEIEGGATLQAKYPGKYFNMGPDPRLPPMPEKPTLMDYFKNRFASTNHLLQSGALALKNGHSEKVVLACLLHDIAVVSFIRCDHGYWGAQMIAPYVDEEVSEASACTRRCASSPTSRSATPIPTCTPSISARTTCRSRTSRKSTSAPATASTT